MRMEQLHYLVDVAETKSMSKTAERLFVTPQAVSKSLRQLEQELDEALLVRANTGVVPTKIGASVVAIARNILKEEANMKQLIALNKQNRKPGNTFSIRICSTSAIANVMLPEIIARVSRMNINIIPRIYMVDTLQDLLDHVEQGMCDIGLVTYNEEALFQKFAPYHHGLQMDLLARDELVVVMDRQAHRFEQETISIQEFLGHFFTMFSLMPVDTVVQAALKNQVMRSNDAEFHRAMIEKLDAYVLMPRRAYQHFFHNDSYIAVQLENSHPSLLHAALYRKDAPEDLHKFAALVRTGMQEGE